MELNSVLDYKNFEDGIWYVEKIPDGFSAGRLAKKLDELPQAKFRFQFKKIKPEVYNVLLNSDISEDLSVKTISRMFELFCNVVENKLFK